jgi:hypothetical protein
MAVDFVFNLQHSSNVKEVPASFKTAKLAENGGTFLCSVEKAELEPRTLGTGAERAANCACNVNITLFPMDCGWYQYINNQL